MLAKWIGLGIWVLIGSAYCFYGYRLFRWMCRLLGAGVGFLLGMVLFPQPDQVAIAWTAGIILGIGGFYIGWRYYLLGVFLTGALAVATGVEVFVQTYQPENGAMYIIGGALLGGLLIVWLQKPLIVGYTAWGGAMLLAFSKQIMMMTPAQIDKTFAQDRSDLEILFQQGPQFMLLVFGLFLLGMFIQFKYTAIDPDPDEEEVKKQVKQKKQQKKKKQ